MYREAELLLTVKRVRSLLSLSPPRSLGKKLHSTGHFVGRIKGDKYRFELQFLKWDFSGDAVAAQGYILR